VSLIFVSYRRDDTAPYAGRLYDRLTAHFGKGQVFMDIDHIAPGEDFVEVIDRKVGACSIAVVLIGRHWLTAVDAEGKRRLDDPEDFVRLEVAAALQRNVRVVPVLVAGAPMPKPQQLPGPLAALSRRNAFEISDSRFHADVDRLIEALERAPAATDEHGAAAFALPRFSASARALAIAALVAVAVGLAAVVVPTLRGGGSTSSAAGDARDAPAPVSAPPATLQGDRSLTGPDPVLSDSRLEAGRKLAGSVEMRDEYKRLASAGSADAQYRLAVVYECGDQRDLPLATHWYEAASGQGHEGARQALATLREPLPVGARDREVAATRREMNCLGRLQQNLTESIDDMNKASREAIRNIRGG